jgi:hypothetical protein
MQLPPNILTIIDRQGWNDNTLIDLMAEWIGEHTDSFKAFLEKKAEEENVKLIDSSNLIDEIKDGINEWDGEDLANLANQVRTEKVKYIGDSMFEVMNEEDQELVE